MALAITKMLQLNLQQVSIPKILKMIFLGIPALCMVITAPSFSKSMFGNLKLQIDHWIISLSHFKSATFIANSGAKIFS